MGIPGSVGRVTQFQCGRAVTVAVVAPTTKPEEVRDTYRCAVQADSYNADVLRQYEVGRENLLGNLLPERNSWSAGVRFAHPPCVYCPGADVYPRIRQVRAGGADRRLQHLPQRLLVRAVRGADQVQG
jgi:hypothetical protein